MAQTVYYSGIDLHKRTSVIHTVDSDGQVVKQAKLRNTCEALRTYFSAPDGRHHAVVEATAGWYWVSDLLERVGVDVTLAHATDLKAISHAKVKTDRVDAAMLAQLLRVDLIPVAYRMAGERRGQRDLLRTRLRLVERRTRCLNSLARLLEKFNVKVAGALPELYRRQARYHREQVHLLRRQIKDIEATLMPLLRQEEDMRRLCALPGIGKLVAATLLLEIGEIERFPSFRQFCSYCRLVPGADNSAGHRRHRSGHKAGNRYLKLAFSHAAVRAVQHYPVIRAAFRKRRRKKPPKVARAWIAKELARIVYHVLKHQEDFDGCFRGEPLRHRKTPQWPRPAGPGRQTGRPAATRVEAG